jgi:hypothetical protein
LSEPPESGPPESGPQGPTVKDRWWVDTGDKRREAPRGPGGPAGADFYRSAIGFEQETARARLTDLNMKLLVEANPVEAAWSYVRLAETAYPDKDRERIKGRVPLASYARGVVVDCGGSLRLLVTGTPIGERILDLTLGDAPSFDCWVDGEWIREQVFENPEEAIRALPGLIDEYLSPQGIAYRESLRPRA